MTRVQHLRLLRLMVKQCGTPAEFRCKPTFQLACNQQRPAFRSFRAHRTLDASRLLRLLLPKQLFHARSGSSNLALARMGTGR